MWPPRRATRHRTCSQYINSRIHITNCTQKDKSVAADDWQRGTTINHPKEAQDSHCDYNDKKMLLSPHGDDDGDEENDDGHGAEDGSDGDGVMSTALVVVMTMNEPKQSSRCLLTLRLLYRSESCQQP